MGGGSDFFFLDEFWQRGEFFFRKSKGVNFFGRFRDFLDHFLK